MTARPISPRPERRRWPSVKRNSTALAGPRSRHCVRRMSTVAPASTPSPSGSTASALAPTSALSWCEPWPPAERTCSMPVLVGVGHDPGEVDLAVGAPLTAPRRPPPARGDGRGRHRGGPSSCAAPAGRTARRTRPTTPGCPAARTPAPDGIAVATPDGPEGEGLGRPDGHLHPAHVAHPVEHHLDVVEVAHAHAAAGEEGVAGADAVREASPMASSSSPIRPRSTPTAPVWATRASSVRRFESRIWPGARACGPRPARRRSTSPPPDRPARRAPRRCRRWPARPRWPAVSTSPGGIDDVARAQVVTGRADGRRPPRPRPARRPRRRSATRCPRP